MCGREVDRRWAFLKCNYKFIDFYALDCENKWKIIMKLMSIIVESMSRPFRMEEVSEDFILKNFLINFWLF